MYVVPVTTRYTPIAEHDAPTLWPPACAGRGVTFILFQTHTESPFAVRATRTVTGAARCTATGEWIPAMAWTAEMERAFRDLRAATPARAAFRFQHRFLRVLAVVAPLGALAVGLLLWQASRPNAFALAEARIAAVAAAPASGAAVLLADPPAPRRPPAQRRPPAFRWFVIRSVSAEAVVLQAAPSATEDAFAEPDRALSAFTGPTRRVPRALFLTEDYTGPPPTTALNAYPADAP